MIRTVQTSFGKRYYAVCNTRMCGNEAEIEFTGVEHKEDAMPGYAPPRGWREDTVRTMGRGLRYMRVSVCPDCQQLGL